MYAHSDNNLLGEECSLGMNSITKELVRPSRVGDAFPIINPRDILSKALRAESVSPNSFQKTTISFHYLLFILPGELGSPFYSAHASSQKVAGVICRATPDFSIGLDACE